MRLSVSAGHEKAVGEKSRYGHDDPARVAQFERLLAEQQSLEHRRLPDPRHLCRPHGMTIAEWRKWFMGLEEGIELAMSAGRYGKGKPVDGHQHVHERLGA